MINVKNFFLPIYSMDGESGVLTGIMFSLVFSLSHPEMI